MFSVLFTFLVFMKQNLNCIIFPLRLTSKWSWSDRVCVRLGLCCARFPLIHTYWFDHMSQRSHLKCRLHPLEGLEVTVLIKLFFPLSLSLTLTLSFFSSGIPGGCFLLTLTKTKQQNEENNRKKSSQSSTESDDTHGDALAFKPHQRYL